MMMVLLLWCCCWLWWRSWACSCSCPCFVFVLLSFFCFFCLLYKNCLLLFGMWWGIYCLSSVMKQAKSPEHRWSENTRWSLMCLGCLMYQHHPKPTLKLRILRKRRPPNWVHQTAPVLVPHKWHGTKTGLAVFSLADVLVWSVAVLGKKITKHAKCQTSCFPTIIALQASRTSGVYVSTAAVKWKSSYSATH